MPDTASQDGSPHSPSSVALLTEAPASLADMTVSGVSDAVWVLWSAATCTVSSVAYVAKSDMIPFLGGVAAVVDAISKQAQAVDSNRSYVTDSAHRAQAFMETLDTLSEATFDESKLAPVRADILDTLGELHTLAVKWNSTYFKRTGVSVRRGTTTAMFFKKSFEEQYRRLDLNERTLLLAVVGTTYLETTKHLLQAVDERDDARQENLANFAELREKIDLLSEAGSAALAEVQKTSAAQVEASAELSVRAANGEQAAAKLQQELLAEQEAKAAAMEIAGMMAEDTRQKLGQAGNKLTLLVERLEMSETENASLRGKLDEHLIASQAAAERRPTSPEEVKELRALLHTSAEREAALTAQLNGLFEKAQAGGGSSIRKGQVGVEELASGGYPARRRSRTGSWCEMEPKIAAAVNAAMSECDAQRQRDTEFAVSVTVTSKPAWADQPPHRNRSSRFSWPPSPTWEEEPDTRCSDPGPRPGRRRSFEVTNSLERDIAEACAEVLNMRKANANHDLCDDPDLRNSSRRSDPGPRPDRRRSFELTDSLEHDIAEACAEVLNMRKATPSTHTSEPVQNKVSNPATQRSRMQPCDDPDLRNSSRCSDPGPRPDRQHNLGVTDSLEHDIAEACAEVLSMRKATTATHTSEPIQNKILEPATQTSRMQSCDDPDFRNPYRTPVKHRSRSYSCESDSVRVPSRPKKERKSWSSGDPDPRNPDPPHPDLTPVRCRRRLKWFDC